MIPHACCCFISSCPCGLWLASRIIYVIAGLISHTRLGPKESLLHLLMFGEIAIPLLMCLFLEINALVFAVMIAAFLAHEATALWDVSYAIDKRYVSPLEQHVHSFLEMIPLMAGSFVAVLHWSQLLALFGLGTERARFSIAWKSEPLPVLYIVAVLGASLLFELLPYLEELWRGWRASKVNQSHRIA
jgi:hypothetical protein